MSLLCRSPMLAVLATISCAKVLGFQEGVVVEDAGAAGGATLQPSGGTPAIGSGGAESGGSSGDPAVTGGTSSQGGAGGASGSSNTALAGATASGGTAHPTSGGASNAGQSASGGRLTSAGTSATGGSVSTGGIVSTGGKPSGGNSSTTTGTACSNTSTIGAPGTCCVQNGAFGCAANASVHKVICTNGTWVTNGDCTQGNLCDTRSGGTVGSCLPVVPECAGKQPNQGTCNKQVAEVCGPDLVSVSQPQTCSGQTPICAAGKCTSCPTTGGPLMVTLPQGYCVDSTEVTRSQYQTWLNTQPDTSNQIAVCSWNSSFTPADWPYSGKLDYPVAYVDWCDAYAYCAAVGKRLCGGVTGGSADYGQSAVVTASQWFNACSSNSAATYSYPYGGTYSKTACNGLDAGKGAAVAAATGMARTCQSPASGYAGVFDMSGNVAEWEDSCSSVDAYDAHAHCRLRGGSFYSQSADLACASDRFDARSANNDDIGFRCCFP